jgi:protein TonB
MMLSLVAHLVVLAVLFRVDAPSMSDSRILDAVESRFVSVSVLELPPRVEVAQYVVPEPVEREPVEEPEYEAVPTADTIDVEEPVELAREESPEPRPVEVEPTAEPSVVATNMIPAAEPVTTTAEESAPVSVPSLAVVVAAPELASEPESIVEPEGRTQVDGEQVHRARLRYERQVRSRLSQLGDAPRRILQTAGSEGPFEVELVAVVDARGRILELRLIRSSGVPALDEFAQAAVERLRRLVRVPSELGADARQVPISLVYEA